MYQTKYLPDEIIDGFKNVITQTIQRCRCLYQYPNKKRLDNFLMYPQNDNHCMLIGCMDGGNFLLDSDFIYLQFQDYWKSANEKASAVPNQKAFFECLYHTKDIIPYGLHFRRPLYNIRMEDNSKHKKYFCIAKESIGYTNDMINWL